MTRTVPSTATRRRTGATVDHAASSRGGFRSGRMSVIVDALRRRRFLGRRPQPDDVAMPPLRLLWHELGSILCPPAYRLAYGSARMAPSARSRAVVLVPGFGSHPWRMAPMRKALETAGHRVTDWGLGWNLGASEDRFRRLVSRVDRASRAYGEPVVLVGWSLGGVFARQVAKEIPEAVEMVITLGSPFSGDMHGNRAWRLYELIAGHRVDEPPVKGEFASKPPVPTYALWSARDGIVHRRCAGGKNGERDGVSPVRCTHMGFAWHPAAIEAVHSLMDAHGGSGRRRPTPEKDDIG